VHTDNFAHLGSLPIDTKRIKETLLALRHAEELHDGYPHACICMCRAALESLALGFEAWLDLSDSNDSLFKLDESLNSLIRYHDGRRLLKQSEVWKELQRRKSFWNRIVHRNEALDSDGAIKQLEFFHRVSWALCSLHRKPNAPVPDAPVFIVRPGIRQQLEGERTARNFGAQRLSELEEELAQHKERASVRATSEQSIASQLKQAERDLEKANADLLSARRQESSVAPELQKMVLAADKRATDLASKAAVLEGELEAAREERESAQERASVVEKALVALRGKVRKARDERKSLEYAERRRMRYEREYPGIARAHEFLQASIDGDAHGALPPLDGLDNLIELSADRYAIRFECSFRGRSGTLRVIRAHAGVETDERCRAWEIEASNLSQLTRIGARPGIAALLSVGHLEKPGFAVFDRPVTQLLSQFGSNGSAMRLAGALRFTDALHIELSTRAFARLSVSWPDFDAVGVHESLPVLLEPSAPLAGDTGPAGWIGRSAEQCRQMSREELERGWTYALAHAALRMMAFLPTAQTSGSIQVRVQEAQLRAFLEEGRRHCDEPLSLESVRSLAAVLVAAIEIEERKRPHLEQLIHALRAPFNHR
jgi:hypothetical protein